MYLYNFLISIRCYLVSKFERASHGEALSFLYYSLMEELKITLVQSDLFWENPSKNLEKLESSILNCTDIGDLIILPEMFSTGFSMKPASFSSSVSPQEIPLAWMKKIASKFDAAICGSLISEENSNYYNRLFFVLPNGEFHIYDKRHLFSLAGEEKVYSPGKGKLILEFKGWKINPLVCYDLRFPVWCRNNQEVDLILFVANWPERRSEAWKSLLKARAIENMCYVAGVNRVGEDGNGIYHSGDSSVFNSLGKLISNIPEKLEATETICLNKKEMLEARKRFGFLNDRDNFKVF